MRWGQQAVEREWVFTPQSGKRPDEDREYPSTRWLERRGPERTNIGESWAPVTETKTWSSAGGRRRSVG